MQVIDYTKRMKGVLCKPHPKKSGEFQITERNLDPEAWVRVIPETSRDIFWLTNLVKDDERCAPFVHDNQYENEGDGIFVRRQLLGKYLSLKSTKK